jgi:rubrerythrin
MSNNGDYVSAGSFIFSSITGVLSSISLSYALKAREPSSTEERQDMNAVIIPADEVPNSGVLLQGSTKEELSYALNIMDTATEPGDKVEISIVSTYLPTEEDLANFVVRAAQAGIEISFPSVDIEEGLPATTFIMTKGQPAAPGTTSILPALIGIIPVALITGLIGFGVFKIESITKALMPILLVTFGGLIVLVGLLSRKHVVKAAGQVAKAKYAPQTLPKLRSREAPADHKPTRDQVKVRAWSERDRLGIWVTDLRNDRTIAQWWDDDARQMFEDGFFKPGVPQFSYEKPSPIFVESVLDTIEEQGIIEPSGMKTRTLPQTRPRASEVQSKITPSTPDEICRQCQQYYEGACRAYSVPHSKEEEQSRTGPYGMECDDPDLKERRWMRFGVLYHTPPGKYDEPYSHPEGVKFLSDNEYDLPDSFATKEQWEDWRRRIVDKIYEMDQGHRWGKSQLEGFSVHELSNIYRSLCYAEKYRADNELPPEWRFIEETPEPILEVTPGMLPQTEKGWKDFYTGNRIQASIDAYNWRIKERNVSEEQQQKLHDSLKTDFMDLVEYQNLQSFGFASGLLNKEEALQLYAMYGGETPSPEKWDQLTLAEKITGTKMAEELIGAKLRKGLTQTQRYEEVEMYCRECGQKIPSPASFRTPDNLRVYFVTGKCQECQDKVEFGGDRDIIQGLELSMDEEQRAADTYLTRMKTARYAGDDDTAKVYEHVIGEEMEHKQEFSRRKDELAMNFHSDTSEYLSQTIDMSGLRGRLETSFQEAMTRARGD